MSTLLFDLIIVLTFYRALMHFTEPKIRAIDCKAIVLVLSVFLGIWALSRLLNKTGLAELLH